MAGFTLAHISFQTLIRIFKKLKNCRANIYLFQINNRNTRKRFAAVYGSLVTKYLNIETKGTANPFRQVHSTNITATTQPTFTCSKLTIETLEKGVKYVQN